MHESRSPWVTQLKREMNHKNIDADLSTDITIIGAGISGVVTAYYLLKDTDQKVILVDAFKVGHGATGHNAGQVVGYFEKDFTEIIKEFGLEKAVNAQKNIFESWDRLEEIIDFANLQVPLSKFTGYAGCQTHEQLLEHLEKKLIRDSHGIQIDGILIDSQYKDLDKIPEKYNELYKTISQAQIQEFLRVKNTDYIACLATRKGTLNSSLFCEELLGFLLQKYNKQLQVFEHSHISKINLYSDKIILDTYSTKDAEAILNSDQTKTKVSPTFQITSHRVILCTNGYKNFRILDFTNDQYQTQTPDFSLTDEMYGVVGYMAGYLEKEVRPGNAISYFPKSDSNVYVYLTSREYELLSKFHNLTCIGGPEEKLTPDTTYDRLKKMKTTHVEEIKKFLNTDYQFTPDKLELDFAWHGLMGYTKNMIRIVGPEPKYKNLMYNLGCNGIGILPSIFGGWKINQFVQSKVTEPSIFDPM
jgi:glycine/D-amino acid oxidase-like deaminating enzyme